jgi:hypothetical protein
VNKTGNDGEEKHSGMHIRNGQPENFGIRNPRVDSLLLRGIGRNSDNDTNRWDKKTNVYQTNK